MARKGENIYKRKDGRYEGRYIKEYNSNGKTEWGYVYGKTYSEVKEKLNVKKFESKSNKAVVSVNMSLYDWIDKWIATQRQIKPTTKMMYYSHLKNHIKDNIGSLPLKKLNDDIIQGFIDSETEKYSAKTVHSVFSMLRLSLSAANEKGYIGKIYLGIRLPKVKKSVLRVLSPKEQKALENIILRQENRYDIGILICLYTGIRIGELCALTWENVDLNNGTVSIVSTAVRVKNDNKKDSKKTRIVFSEPKSLSSIRIIPIPDFLIKLLKTYKRENGYMLRDDGRYADTRSISRRFKKLLKAASLPDLNFHILRHTFATRALELGFDVKTLSEILGHSSITITLNLYAHLLQRSEYSQ